MDVRHDEQKQIAHAVKWWRAKAQAYMMLIYVIPCIVIGNKLGLKAELFYLGGGIHLAAAPVIKNWFMKKF